MITKKRKLKKRHIALIVSFSIILAGCGIIKKTTSLVDNTASKTNKINTSVKVVNNIDNTQNSVNNNTDYKIKEITWHGCNNNEISDNDSVIMNIVNKLSPDDFIAAQETYYPVLTNGAKLNYSGKFSDEKMLYFLNYGYTLRAFILRTGQPEYASYDVYILDTSHWNQKDVMRDKESLDDSPEIFRQLKKSKFTKADFDNDGEIEIALYMTENPYNLDEYKTFYMFDQKSYENGYKEYELYSYTKDNYRYFAEQVCINFDNYENQSYYQQAAPPDFFDNIIKNPDKNYSYKSKKNMLFKVRDTFSDYNYIITDKIYKNNYEFGNQNNYTLQDGETQIKTSIGIVYQKKGENQNHNANFSAVLQYKGNGEFELNPPYSFKISD